MDSSSLPKGDLISVVMPAYNAEKYVQESLDSLYQQSCTADIEIIVVNDGSSDSTLDILENQQTSNLKIVSQTNKGPLLARNAGIKIASGNFIAFLDADDYFLPDKLEKQWLHMRANEHLDMTFCLVEQFVCEKAVHKKHTLSADLKIVSGMSYYGGFFKRSLFQEIDLNNGSEGESGNFLGWFAKAQVAKYKHDVVAEVMYRRRLHDNNFGLLSKDKQVKSYFNTLFEKLKKEKEL
jgi:glycosyltransferase involved in cell wall biosynthesis